MAAIKKYGFLILNGIILLATLILYFFMVSGRREDLEKLEGRLEKDRKKLVSLSLRKPTDRWYDVVKKNIEQVNGGLQSIENGPKLADQAIHKFFDLENPSEIIDKAPDRNDYSVFKEMMVKKWDSLIQAFCAPNGPFGLQSKVLNDLEPEWLRSDIPPTHEHQVIDAMKSYWITMDILELLSENKVRLLNELGVSSLSRTSDYQISEKDFWGYRTVQIKGRIDVDNVEKLFESFSDPERLYRVTGFSFANVIVPPVGVNSDAPFLRFSEDEPQVFTLTLMHFDYLREGESFDKVATVKEDDNASNRRNRRRRR